MHPYLRSLTGSQRQKVLVATRIRFPHLRLDAVEVEAEIALTYVKDMGKFLENLDHLTLRTIIERIEAQKMERLL